MKKTTINVSASTFKLFGVCTFTLFFNFASFAQKNEASNIQEQSIEFPIFASENEKTEWIKNNPETYVLIRKSNNSELIAKFESIDEFPEFIETGNFEKDIEDHQKRKNAWISAHPEEYLRMQETLTPSPEQLEIMNAKSTKTN